MQVTSHQPRVTRIVTLGDPGCEFQAIHTEDSSGGHLVLFIDDDWKQWDAMVAAVGLYRAEQAAARRNGVGVPVAAERAGAEQ
ncbi:hypothetical protein [Mycolicibacterium brisbanense]|uniref:Gp79 n=1 Tax=Mycolicibacterium brisbanense TaxID=146020 RepID=A0A100W6U8_9MYCO|nr:hypothetical protein [Mycolicibacterium brisbanense]MCV7157998.1 hypothetical protein [Mycolicibacterium brisbanense]GAS92646.1 Gp79 [Mycolicibacterium brisbanense]